jgi:uncharacterized protein
LGDSAIEHFHDKLLHIRDRLKTDAGKRMGEKRHQFVRRRVVLYYLRVFAEHSYHFQMLDFLAAIDEEYAS